MIKSPLYSWSKSVLFIFILLAGLAALSAFAPSTASALANCDGAAAPCVEDPAIDGCVQCHSMQIVGGNRSGTDRFITRSLGNNRHILDPRLANWASNVDGMVAKGAQGVAATMTAYLNSNYCPTCNGPILSSPSITGVTQSVATIGWTTEVLATSCVIYGTSTTSLTGDTCNAADPNHDPNNASLVTSHSVPLAGLTALTRYFVVHRSAAGGQTATYAAAKSFTTSPGGDGGGGGGGLGTVISLATGDYNNDTNPDIAVGVSVKNHVVAYLGNGSGGFTEGQKLTNVGTTPVSITSGGVKGDVNGDNTADLAVANFGSKNVAIFLGTGTATPIPNPNPAFQSTPVSTIPLTDPPTSVAFGDWNRDGRLDLAVATVGSTGNLLIFAGAGNGNFAPLGAPIPISLSTAIVPTIDQITPSAVDCLALPRNVTVRGSFFLEGSAVFTLDGVTPLAVQSTSPDSTEVVLRIPSGAQSTPGAHSIVVTLGTESASRTFTVNPRPVTITQLSPASNVYGVTPTSQVNIFGTNFILGARVTVGSLSGTTVAGLNADAATPFVHMSSTQLRFYWPNTSLAVAAYDVTVTNQDLCAGSATATRGFTVAAPQPTISTGAQTVTYGISSSRSVGIAGTNFMPGATITVGSLSGVTVPGVIVSATNPFGYNTSGQLFFWWPNTSLVPAAYTVQVTNPAAAGGLSASQASGFTVTAPQPSVTSTSPNSVIYGTTAGREISVYGANFILGARITVGSLSGATVAGSNASATTPFVYLGSTQLKFWWPNTSLAPGAYAVWVTNPVAAGELSGTLAGAFTVTAPQPSVSSINLVSAVYGVTASRQVMISGSNFLPTARITVGSLSGETVLGSTASAATPFVYMANNSTQLLFWWPNTSLTAGTYEVRVTNPVAAGGLSGSLLPGFTVSFPQPSVSSTSINPVTYGITSSASITISGSNFFSGAVVTVGGLTGTTVAGSTASAAMPFVYVASNQLKFWWSNTSLSPGAYAVQVTNPAAIGGLTTSLGSAFTVTAPLPSVTSASPNPVTYGVTGSQKVVISGANFLLGSTITIQGPGGTLTGVTVSGSAATATVRFVYRFSSWLEFWWGNTSLPVGTYDVIVTNPAASGGLTGARIGGFVVQ